jgi:hypothetical protein
MRYIFILIKKLIIIKIYVCGLIQFKKINSKSNPIQPIFTKTHPTHIKKIQFFAFNLFEYIWDFYLNRFGFEQHT